MEERVGRHHQIDTRSSAFHAPPTGEAVKAVPILSTENEVLRRGITSPARAPQYNLPQIFCWKSALDPTAAQGKGDTPVDRKALARPVQPPSHRLDRQDEAHRIVPGHDAARPDHAGGQLHLHLPGHVPERLPRRTIRPAATVNLPKRTSTSLVTPPANPWRRPTVRIGAAAMATRTGWSGASPSSTGTAGGTTAAPVPSGCGDDRRRREHRRRRPDHRDRPRRLGRRQRLRVEEHRDGHRERSGEPPARAPLVESCRVLPPAWMTAVNP